jgi:hypothetical protein
MILAKGACPGNGNTQKGSYFAASFSGSLPSTALRQRL